MRLVFDYNGDPVPDQIQIRRYSCICDSCKMGGNCSSDWLINEWINKQLVRKEVANQEENEPLELHDDNLVLQ